MVASIQTMDGSILKVIMIPCPGYGCVIMLQSKLAPIQLVYQLPVSSLSKCNCPAFKDLISKFGRNQNYFLHCGHFNFIFIKVCNIEYDINLFIHTPHLASTSSKSSSRGAIWDIVIPRFPHGLVPHCTLIYMAICEPHAYSQIFFYNKYNLTNTFYTI